MQAVKEITYPCKFDGSQQPAMFYQAKGTGPRPLLVALHTWSGDHTQPSRNYSDFCIENDWNFIFPNFRGPNWLEDGCGSELVVSDLEDAVAYMKQVTDVDPARVYLVGGSGGGHCTLLMADVVRISGRRFRHGARFPISRPGISSVSIRLIRDIPNISNPLAAVSPHLRNMPEKKQESVPR